MMANELNSCKGLEARDKAFWIDGEPTRLFSGAIHYFRVPRQYWKNRLCSLRAAGCNVLETYVPWNLHEPRRSEFDFKDDLDLRGYVQLAQECGLYVILRPGPYICSEWDLGGLPSWLLSDENMKLRSTHQPYMSAVKCYFEKLLPLVTDLQYSNGGPIIAWQIENEYGSFGKDTEYLIQVKTIMEDCGCSELFFTSDNEQGILNGAVDGGAYITAPEKIDIGLGKEMLAILEERQPDMPRMCMEFWSGWFDHWTESKHQTWSLEEFTASLTYTLENYGSVNFYMFHGGTNFGFMNGANEQTENDQLKNGLDYLADVTSYDYDAPVSEEGQLTEKYWRTVELLKPYLEEVKFLGPAVGAAVPPPSNYGILELEGCVDFETILASCQSCSLPGRCLPMEKLPFGQGYGWTCYSKRLESGGTLLFEGQVRDRAQVFMDSTLVSQFDCNSLDNQVMLESGGLLRVLVENMGRTNYQPIDKTIMDVQHKGLNGPVRLDGEELLGWEAQALDFSPDMVKRLLSVGLSGADSLGPSLWRCQVTLSGKTEPRDTFLNMEGWGKGIVLVNGRNLGRYWPLAGPTKTLYLPGPWLKQGSNEIHIFELEKCGMGLRTVDTPQL